MQQRINQDSEKQNNYLLEPHEIINEFYEISRNYQWMFNVESNTLYLYNCKSNKLALPNPDGLIVNGDKIV